MSNEGLTLLVGTTKGAFLLSGGNGRAEWDVAGPFCGGWPINHVIGDPGSGTIWAGGGGDWHGAGVWRSTDGGSTWQVARLSRGTIAAWPETSPEFAAMVGWSQAATPFAGLMSQVWWLGRAGDALAAGTEPAGLVASGVGGATWERVESLTDQP